MEKPLQSLIERNLEVMLGIRFLATEYSTGKTHAGRIDTLGIDENDCPVILEYKRSVGENVINQGLFYLDWLLDHKAEFKLLVLDVLGAEAAGAIDWTSPRVICIAADFTKYDAHAVQQIGRNIELIRYRRFGEDLLLFEQANAVSSGSNRAGGVSRVPKATLESEEEFAPKVVGPDKPFSEVMARLPEHLKAVMESLEDYTLSLGDDVQRKELRLYVAYKRLKNFATLAAQKSRLILYLHVDPETVVPQLPTIARDVSQIGHWGTGSVEVTLTSLADLEAIKPFIASAYEGRARAHSSTA